METVVMSFCGLCLLLILGKLVRTAVPLFQRLYLPASVIGGLIGLLWINTLGKDAPPEWHASWNALPGFLINIVFAALFIGAKIPKLRTIWHEAAPQLCMGQLIAWGQYVIGLGLAFAVLVPLFGVNAAFGNLLEIGFEGGHGTVARADQNLYGFQLGGRHRPRLHDGNRRHGARHHARHGADQPCGPAGLGQKYPDLQRADAA